MPSRDRGAVVKGVKTLFDSGTTLALGDSQLLERFLLRGDDGAEAAFSALVERHGPMVERVCWGVLRDVHATEDAFQATFLILALKGRLDSPACVGFELALWRSPSGRPAGGCRAKASG